MTPLMAAPATATLADVHSEPPADRPRLGQLLLILKVRALMLDLSTTITPRHQRRH